MKPFTKWVIRQGKDKDRSDPVADLGEDFARDTGLPRDAGIRELRVYLSRYGEHVAEAFEEARAEYRAHRAARLARKADADR
jgi:hypothetical protein